MRLPVKPVRGKVRSDGTSIIYFQYCYSWDPDLKTLLNTGIEIPAGCWDKQKECITADLPREYGTWEKLNEELDRKQRQRGPNRLFLQFTLAEIQIGKAKHNTDNWRNKWLSFNH
jgi:hypothetical protein